MLDLLKSYSLTDITIFIVMLAFAIKGIVDFTHTHFTVKDDVVVQTVDVVVAIQELVLKMHVNDE